MVHSNAALWSGTERIQTWRFYSPEADGGGDPSRSRLQPE